MVPEPRTSCFQVIIMSHVIITLCLGEAQSNCFSCQLPHILLYAIFFFVVELIVDLLYQLVLQLQITVVARKCNVVN